MHSPEHSPSDEDVRAADATDDASQDPQSNDPSLELPEPKPESKLEDEEASRSVESDSDDNEPPSSPSSSNQAVQVTLVRIGKQLACAERPELRNNLLGAVGFLELANAGDFAANVWNTIPVPMYAVVFMAIGGTVAAVLSVYAFRDARASWNNVRFLRAQRQMLREERARRVRGGQPLRDIDVLLDVSYRELGTEGINRWGMDVLMGGGAILIAAGTFMAIDGANPQVWEASNLLSGYIGNAPITVYGLVNSAWAFYIFRTASHHKSAAAKVLRGSPVMAMLRRRVRNVQIYAGINGTATLMGGIGSMITATRWWGYIILIPVIISSLFCNIWFRHRVGYDRPYFSGSLELTTDSLTGAMQSAVAAHRAVRHRPDAPLDRLVDDSGSLGAVLGFLIATDLLEAFCLRLAGDARLAAAFPSLLDPRAAKLTISVPELLAVPEDLYEPVIQVAQDCVRRDGPRHFESRERYIAEILGSFLSIDCHAGEPQDTEDKEDAAKDTDDEVAHEMCRRQDV